MRTVGFSGGGLIAELGSAEDVQMFFDLINEHVAKKQPGKNWSILMDRLYKRYLRENELDVSILLMNFVEEEFKNIKNNLSIGRDSIDCSGVTLYDVFENYFKNFSLCADMVRLSYEEFKNTKEYQYEPIRIVITDQPWYLLETTRKLEEYDCLEGDPFWKISHNP